MDFNKLPDWIRTKLDERGMSVEDLAVAAKVSRRLIYMYLNDEARPTHNTGPRIVAGLNSKPLLVHHKNGTVTLDEETKVSLAEFYQQYTPNTLGRPRGSARKTSRRR